VESREKREIEDLPSADRRSFARSDPSLMIVAFRDWLVQGLAG
jgi:hypothetical protein